MKLYISILLILFTSLMAQSGSVSGKVTDATNNSPLIGANVILEGTSLGAATDGEGRYEIKGLASGWRTRSLVIRCPDCNVIFSLKFRKPI